MYASNAKAEFVATGAAANIGNSPSGGQGTSAIGGGSSASFSFSGLRDTVSAKADSGAGNYSNNGLMKLSAISRSFTAGPDSLVSSLAIATYSDRIFSANNTNLSQFLRLELEISGVADLVVSGDGTVASYGGAGVDFSWSPGFTPASSLFGISGIGYTPDYGAFVVMGGDGLSQIGLTNFVAGSNGLGVGFKGKIFVDTDSSYGFYMVTRVTASSYNASAFMNVGNTVTLLNVYNSNGQKIAFSDLSFESGSSFSDIQAVPEPATVVGFAVGIVCFAGYGLRRRVAGV